MKRGALVRWTRPWLAGLAMCALAACGTGQADDAPSRSALLTTQAGATPSVTTSTSSPTPTPSPSPVVTPTPFIVLMDTSAATAETPMAPGMTRLQSSAGAVQQVTARLASLTPTSLIEFGSPAATEATCGNARLSVRQGTPAQVGETATHATPGAGASLASGLELVRDLVPKDGKARVVVVSGPAGSCGMPDPCAVAAELHTQHPDLVISTVAVGSPTQSLSCLASATGGAATNADTPVQLVQRLGMLGEENHADRVIVPVTGVHGVHVGMTLDEARAAQSTFPMGGSTPGDQPGLPDGTVAVIVWRGSAFAVNKSEIITAIIAGPESSTIDGLRIGDPATNADAFLGGPVKTDRDGARTVRSYDADGPSGLQWRILAEDDVISHIVLTKGTTTR